MIYLPWLLGYSKLAVFFTYSSYLMKFSKKNTFFLHEMDKLTVVLMSIKWLNKIERPLVLWSSPWYKWPAAISRSFLNWPSLQYNTHLSAETLHFAMENSGKCTYLQKICQIKVSIKLFCWNALLILQTRPISKIREIAASHLYQGLDQSTEGFLVLG